MNIDSMVQRFLAWPLPEDVCADAVACKQGAPHRTGTNLLTHAQAQQMIEHVCADHLAALAAKDAEIEGVSAGLDQAAGRIADLIAEANRAEQEAAGLRAKVEKAYGYLWMVNNEPGTPAQYAPERAAYEARKILRGTLTHEQRGNGITAAMAARAGGGQ